MSSQTPSRSSPGFIEGYRLQSNDSLVGRVTVWETEASADHTAQSTHVLALRSRLNPDVEAGSHQEHAFEGTRFAPNAGPVVAGTRGGLIRSERNW